MATIMSMISVKDLFYGVRESVQILKDENREILETIHRYNYFYAEPPPKSSEDEVLESDWKEIDQLAQDTDEKKDENEEKKDENEEKKDENEEKKDETEEKKVDQVKQEGKVVFKVPMCCTGCEETVTIVLRNVAGVEDVESFLLKEMVTVTGTAAPADLLLACRDLKLFRKTQFWRNDSD